MTKKNTNVIAIITMFFMFAMISFVTNMAAPFGNIWKIKEGMEWSGMMGNMMNFLAYLFMGIPAGKMLQKIGYKKTALAALAVGFVGMLVQMTSSFMEVGMSALIVYLLGAFVCGFCVCMLNTVVNPMLNLLGGGGNRGNQLIQAGGTLNSLTGTATPLLAGAMIGTLTPTTALSNVRPLLLIALAVFALSFLIILFVSIPEPNLGKVKSEEKGRYSAWSFRHLVLGVVAIFFYVGVEVGIPGELNFYLSDPSAKGAGLGAGAAAVGGAIAAVYWLLMFVGRLCSTAISGKVSSKTQITVVSAVAMVFLLIAIVLPKDITMSMPSYVGGGFAMVPNVPMSALFIVLCGLCTSLMWGGIFNLAVEGLGKYTEQASGIFMMMVVGGGVMPFIQDAIARSIGYMASYWLVIAMLGFIFYYAIIGCKNVNKDIPVE